jgi:hypothetical protein
VVPIAPIIFLVWLLGKALSKKEPAAGAAAPAPARKKGTDATWRHLVIAVLICVVTASMYNGLSGIMKQLSGVQGGWAGVAMFGVLLAPLATPFLVLRWLPSWTVWRVLGRRCPTSLVPVLFFFAIGYRDSDRAGFQWLVAARRHGPGAVSLWSGRDKKNRPRAAVDAWLTCAMAIADDGGAERAQQLWERLPAHLRVPHLVRVYGLECLAWGAARRGDWPSAGRWVALARGRGARLLRFLIRARSERPPARWRLWLAWALAPERIRNWPLVVLAPPALRSNAVAEGAPWRGHVRLLAAAADSGVPTLADCQALVQAWAQHLDSQACAHFRARGLALAGRDAVGTFGALRAQILSDLAALAASAAGALPQTVQDDDDFVGEWAGGVRRALFERVEGAARRFDPKQDGWRATPAEAWQLWLALYAAVTRLEEALGSEALRVAWFSGLRTSAWNGPCELYNFDPTNYAWPAAVMFDWNVRLAEQVGDAEAATTNRKNADVARAAIA